MLIILNCFSFPKESLWSLSDLQPHSVFQIPSLIVSTITLSCCQQKFQCKGSYSVPSLHKHLCQEVASTLKSGAGSVDNPILCLGRKYTSIEHLSHNQSRLNYKEAKQSLLPCFILFVFVNDCCPDFIEIYSIIRLLEAVVSYTSNHYLKVKFYQFYLLFSQMYQSPFSHYLTALFSSGPH